MSNNGTFKKYIIDAVTSVKNEIDKDPLQKKELTQLALDAGVGRNLLQKSFKGLFGTGIKEYQFQKRMESAKNMLEEGRLTRKQIAYRCGYRSPNNFSIAFKNYYGISPNEFRNQFEDGNITLMYACN